MKTFALILILTFPLFAQTDRERALNQQLNKALDTVEVQDKLISAQDGQIESQKALIQAQTDLISSLKAGIESRDAQIKALSQIKCSTTSFFWGIVKKKSCL